MVLKPNRPLKSDRLREAREAQSLSQKQLAALCGLGEHQINRYENGKSEPSATYLAKISQTLKISVDYLLGLTDDPHGYIHEGLSSEERELVDAFKIGDAVAIVELTAERLHALGKK